MTADDRNRARGTTLRPVRRTRKLRASRASLPIGGGERWRRQLTCCGGDALLPHPPLKGEVTIAPSRLEAEDTP